MLDVDNEGAIFDKIDNPMRKMHNLDSRSWHQSGKTLEQLQGDDDYGTGISRINQAFDDFYKKYGRPGG